MKNTSTEDKTKELIEAGAEITGTGIGATVGAFFIGPAGAIGGAVGGTLISKVIKKIGSDFHDRLLGPRERVRIGATAFYAIDKINQNIKNGMSLRNDGFFNFKKGERSKAEDILEGVLLKAKNTQEEKKTKYLGNIFGNMAFSGLAAEEANLILQYAEKMTYRELLCLAYIQRKAEFKSITINPVSGKQTFSVSTLGVLHEFYDLYQNFLLFQKRPDAEQPEVLFGIGEIIPAYLYCRPLGEIIYNMMGLNEVPREEIEIMVGRQLE